MDGRTRRALPGMIAKLEAMERREAGRAEECGFVQDSLFMAARHLKLAYEFSGKDHTKLEAPQPSTAKTLPVAPSSPLSSEGVEQGGAAEASTPQGDA